MNAATRMQKSRAGGSPLTRAALAAVAASLIASTALAQSYIISNVPLVVPSALEPNIVLTLDDSEPMRRAFAPDSAFATVGAAQARRFKSAAFNPLYYNPNVSYVQPPHASASPTTFAAALVNGFDGTRGAIDLATGYRPTYTYNPSAAAAYSTNANEHVAADHAAADLGTGSNQVGTISAAGNGAAYYYVYDTTLAGCTSSVNDDNCYRLQRVTATSGPGGTDERQNFANWYSYYRTRNLAMSSAAGRAMASPVLQGTRVAFQGLNSCNSFATGSTCAGYQSGGGSGSSPAQTTVSNLIREFDASARNDLYSWLRRVPAAGTTPLRSAMQRAGQYYGSSASSNNPYLQFPQQSGSSGNPEHACRPSFQLLMAGGGYDDPDAGSYCSGGSCDNADGTVRTLPPPDSKPYSSNQRPYADGNSNTLADAAFHYWATDLRPGLPNVLLPFIRDRSGGSADAQYWNPKNDPARWQHMVNFTVGIGLGAALTDPNIPWTGSSFSGQGYTNLLNGTPWPAPTLGTTGRVYDLWHAALNSRGEFFGADAPEQIVAAMNAALSRTIDQANVGASLAANSTRLTTQSRLYQASFDTRDWTGRLRAINVNTDGSLGTNAWQATAGTNIPAAAARNIFTSSAAVASGIDFTWAALGAASLQFRIGNELTLNYLRGDQSNEISQSIGGTFRDRGVRLGDIVNSEIAFAGIEDFGYDALIVVSGATITGEGLTYPAYVQSKGAIGRKKLVIVGANEGMLHGFDADTGEELFAYVPRAVLNDPISTSDTRSNLVRLADPAYTHRFFVDGSPWVGDAYWGGAWHTAVVSTTGAGGKGVFAIDISNPGSVGPSQVLWDIDGQSDADLGYTIGQAVIGRLNDGYFWAIFGNGYRSTNECAVLYLVRLHDGLTRKISTSTTTTCATPNGLGRPSLHDNQVAGQQGFRITDWAYAGDLLGNIWKFDLTSDNPANWGVAIGGGSPAPLFHARTATGASGVPQPITGTIEIGAAPANIATPSNGSKPAMLWFGTGRYFAVDDRVDTTMQTMYGVLDRGSNAAINSPTGGSAGSRSRLVAQTRTFGANGTGTVSANAVDYLATGSNQKDGWYIDLTAPSGTPPKGERMVGLPLIQFGRLIIPTVIPDDDKCAGGGTSSVLAVDPFTGGALPGTKKFFLGSYLGTSFQAVDFIGSTVGIIRNLVYIGTGSKAYLYAGGSSGNVQVEEVRPNKEGALRGRASWREIIR